MCWLCQARGAPFAEPLEDEEEEERGGTAIAEASPEAATPAEEPGAGAPAAPSSPSPRR